MRRVPEQFTRYGQKDSSNAAKAWLDGYDTAMQEAEARIKEAEAKRGTCRYGHTLGYCWTCCYGNAVSPLEDTGR